MRLRQDNNSINVYVINNIESNGPGQTLAYFDPQEDWLVSRKTEINGSSSTLAHEVGHFFSLRASLYGLGMCSILHLIRIYQSGECQLYETL